MKTQRNKKKSNKNVSSSWNELGLYNDQIFEVFNGSTSATSQTQIWAQWSTFPNL